jgi:hypothetical protein
MKPLYHDPHFTFRFADDRIIPRFHLEGVEAGRGVSVYKIDPDTGKRLARISHQPPSRVFGEGVRRDL